jgi:hypothetical protein
VHRAGVIPCGLPPGSQDRQHTRPLLLPTLLQEMLDTRKYRVHIVKDSGGAKIQLGTSPTNSNTLICY